MGTVVFALMTGAIAGQAQGAIALVQTVSSTAENITSIAATFSNAPGENNLLVAVVGNRAGSDPPNSPPVGPGW